MLKNDNSYGLKRRCLENYCKKVVNLQCKVEFNRACIDENLTPRYVRNKLRRSAKIIDTKSAIISIVKVELSNAEKSLTKAETLYENEKKVVFRELSEPHSKRLSQHIDVFHKRYDSIRRNIITHKLSELYGGQFLLKNNNITHFLNISTYDVISFFTLVINQKLELLGCIYQCNLGSYYIS